FIYLHVYNGMSPTFFFQAEDGIRDRNVTGVQTCALPIYLPVAQLQALALIRAAEDRADHPVRCTRGILVQLLLPGRGAFCRLRPLHELVALGHAQFHDALLMTADLARARLTAGHLPRSSGRTPRIGR